MAEFHQGFVFERGVSARLTIEGNPIDVKEAQKGNGVTAALPSGKKIKAETDSELAKLTSRAAARWNAAFAGDAHS